MSESTSGLVERIASKLTPAAKLNLSGLPRHRHWAMVCEMQPNATGMGMTLLCTRTPPLAERRWTSWGTDRGQGLTRGEGYEYRLTELGLAVRTAALAPLPSPTEETGS